MRSPKKKHYRSITFRKQKSKRIKIASMLRLSNNPKGRDKTRYLRTQHIAVRKMLTNPNSPKWYEPIDLDYIRSLIKEQGYCISQMHWAYRVNKSLKDHIANRDYQARKKLKAKVSIH